MNQKRGYHYGIEYFYDIFGNKIYDAEDEELQREQEDEYEQTTSFYEQEQSNFNFDNFQNREQYKFKIYPKMEDDNYKNYKNYFFKKLISIFDIKYIYGIFKFHVNKPFIENEGNLQQKNKIYFLILNYLSIIFGKYKLTTNIGLHSKFSKLITRIMLRRKFYIWKDYQFYLSTSFLNFHNLQNAIFGISTSIKGYFLEMKKYFREDNSNKNYSFSFSKRSILYSPFGNNSKILNLWKKYYAEQPNMELPPPPKLDYNLYPEMRLFTFLDKFRNIIVQFSKILRYLIDLQLSYTEYNFKFTIGHLKNYVITKLLEQIYLLAIRSRFCILYEPTFQ
ncbi:hypothetical protein ABK040_003215 [Willaertia magna]